MSAILFSHDHRDGGQETKILNVAGNSFREFHNKHHSEDQEKLDGSSTAIYENILGSKMNGLQIHSSDAEGVGSLILNPRIPHNIYCDGSDSGVEITVNATLQRALSNQSGSCTSGSHACLDETAHSVNLSCNSSMISCSSDVYDSKQGQVVLMTSANACRTSINNYECCSENGSESSSVAGPTSMTVRRVTNHSNVKKKVAMFEPAMHECLLSKSKVSHKEAVAAALPASQPQSVKPRLSGLKRAVSLPRPSHGTSPSVRERLNDKIQSNSKASSSCLTPCRNTNQPRTSTQVKPQKPESLPSQLSRTTSMSMQRLVQRTPSLSRARTPNAPDDGRWPSVGSTRSSQNRRGLSVAPDMGSSKMRSSMMASMEIKSSSTSPYGTMPRRRKQKSVEDLTGRSSRSSSISRESRMTSSVIMTSRKNLTNSYSINSNGSTPTQPKSITASLAMSKSSSIRKALTPVCKTKIYHEVSSQTALTSVDLEKVFAGVVPTTRSIDCTEQRNQASQAEIRDQELERLKDEVRHLAQREQDYMAKLKRERDDKLAMQRELHMNTEKVMDLLNLARVAGNGKSLNIGTPTSDEGESNQDSLLMLESQIQLSGNELLERQQEVGQLRKLCRTLQAEMQRSLMQQEILLQEKTVLEQESNEMQDFLQHEKAAMNEALKDLENDYQQCQQQLANKDDEIKVLRDECRHLVRLNEQRRQENRMLQTKFTALESKSKEFALQQTASVSGATAALTGLHSRLDSLVEQLVFSYNISEQDLEDIGFQTDTQMNGSENSIECEASSLRLSLNGHEFNQQPQTLQFAQSNSTQLQLHSASDGSLSPQRNQSFIAAVISAIRNATTHSGKRLLVRHNKRHDNGLSSNNTLNGGSSNQQQEHKLHPLPHENSEHNGDDSDSTEMLDSETEPCLMMDNVLEDVSMPDSHSHNMVSSSTGIISQIDMPSDLVNISTGDDSLHNLSQAIVNRQTVESQISALNCQKIHSQLIDNSCCIEDMSCHDSVAEMPSLVEYSATQAVVDQVIEVDSLITKLLKVLRLIQLDNDNCIQQLIEDKNKLQQSKEDMLEKIKDLQDVNVKLQDELMDATQELMLKNNDVSNSKADIQRHRNEIDRLTEDVCNLSTLCINYRKLSPSAELPPFSALCFTLNSEDSETQDDIAGILNLFKMWQAEGQFKDPRLHQYLACIVQQNTLVKSQSDDQTTLDTIQANKVEERLELLSENTDMRQLCIDLNTVKVNANWSHLLHETSGPTKHHEDINAN